MEVYVLNSEFETVKVVDDFESLIWTDRYDEAGDFEIYVSMNNALLEYFQKGYYLWNKDSEHLMIIETIEISTDSEDGNKLKVTGRSLESILDRRIVWGQKVLDDTLQNAIYTLLDEAFINPSDSDRAIPNFVFEESEDEKITEISVEAEYTGDSIYDIVCTLCQDNGIGFKIVLNDENQFVFSLYAGTDRSYEQSENPYVIFSPGFDNFANSNYIESDENYKNVTLVGGEGEGSAQVFVSVGTATGLDRREIYTDASSVSSDDNGTTLSSSQYKALLEENGTENLVDYKETKSFEGEVDATQMFVYGEDFFVGDIVQVEDKYGHEGRAYVSEFVISQDDGGISKYPTFKTLEDDENEENEEDEE